MPGGVTYVWRGLARISPSPLTTPTDTLFADPSNPNAKIERGSTALMRKVGR